MNKFTYLKSLLLLCALIVGAGTSWAADKWVKTAPADLATGDVVVIVDQTSGTAMSNDNETSKAPAATAITLNDEKDQLTGTIAANLQWKVTKESDSYKFGTGENYLYCTNTNNGVRVGTNTGNAFTIYDNDGVDFLYNTAQKRYIGVYNSADWRCYTSINSNIKDCVTVFYKKESTVDPTKENVTLSFPKASYTADINDGFTAPTATADKTITGIKYTSTNTAVATVVETTGAVTLVKKGTTTIKATFEGDETYNEAEASYELTVTDRNANDGSAEKPYTVAEAIEATPASGTSENVYIKGIVTKFYGDDIVSDGSNYRYYISDDETATNQLLVYKGKGLENVAFADADDLLIGDQVVILGGLTLYKGEAEVASGNYIVSLNRVTKETPTLTLLVDEDEVYEIDATTEEAITDFYKTNSDGEVTFSSSDATVAAVVGDKLQAYKAGTATITVSVAATETYKPISGSFDVKVTVKEAVQPEGSVGGSGYYLVTDASTLAEGDEVIVVCESKGMVMGAQSGTKCDNVEATIDTDNHVITTLPEGTNVITLEGETGKWYLNTDQGYLVSTAAKSIKVAENKEDASSVTISISDGNATISFGDAGTLQYNASNPRFCTYTSNQTEIQLYRYVAGASTFDIEVGTTGWRTIVTAADVTLPSGLTAYVVSANADGKATLQEVESMVANEPYILKGAEDTYTLTVTESASAPTINQLRISDENTGNGVYVLANKTNGVGFYKWNGGSLGAGRVYLPASSLAAEFDFIGFEGDGISTGIEAVEQTTVDGVYYNLAGQRVAQPAKGLYIVNGKKVILK